MNISEGDNCPYTDCSGKIIIPPVKNCYCHINPPCSACTDNLMECDTCGWIEGDPVEEIDSTNPIP